MKEPLNSRLAVLLSITALHLAGLWWVFTVMTQAPQQLPSAAPMVMAQLLPQAVLQPSPPIAPQPQKVTPQPLPKPAPPEPPKQPAPKVVSQPKTIVSDTALTAPKAPEKAVTAPAPAPVEKAAPPAAATATPAAPSAPPAASASAPSPPAAIVAPRFNAAYLNNPPPTYPPLLRRMGEEGKVLLRVYVTSEGNAAEVRIQTGSGSPLFDEAALNAVRQWRFVPARQGDAAVAAWVLVPIAFKLN